jgi:hypothetical protein
MQRSQKRYNGKTSEIGRGAKKFDGGDYRHIYREGGSSGGTGASGQQNMRTTGKFDFPNYYFSLILVV